MQIAFEVRAWVSNHIPHGTMDLIIYQNLNLSSIVLEKGISVVLQVIYKSDRIDVDGFEIPAYNRKICHYGLCSKMIRQHAIQMIKKCTESYLLLRNVSRCTISKSFDATISELIIVWSVSRLLNSKSILSFCHHILRLLGFWRSYDEASYAISKKALVSTEPSVGAGAYFSNNILTIFWISSCSNPNGGQEVAM